MRKAVIFFLFIFLLLIGFSSIVNAQSNNISGQIVDAQSEYPLIGANIIIQDSEPLKGSTTDMDGYFTIKDVPVGRYTLVVKYLGYNEQVIPNVIVTAGKEVVLNISLEEQVLTTDEVVIIAEEDKTQTNNEMATVSARGFTIEETSRYAGSRNDPSRMAQNFAGVSGANDSRNDIIVRGNSPLALLWRLDGIDIPNPSHFSAFGTTGGPVSMLNNNVLENSDFMSGAFPASYGNTVGAAFDLKIRTGNRNKREYMFQVGFNGFEVGLEGPFSKNSNATYLVNYRYSILEWVSQLGVSFGTGTAIPRYQDLSFKFDFPTKNAGRFTLWGLGGISAIDLIGSEETPQADDLFNLAYEDTRVRTNTGMIGFNHLYFFNPSLSNEISIAFSSQGSEIRADSLTRRPSDLEVEQIIPRFGTETRVNRYTIHERVNKKFNARNTLNIGVIADIFNVQALDSILINGTNFVNDLDFNENAALFRAYVEWQHRFSDRLTLNLGTYFQYFELSGSQSIEPRLGLKYVVAPNQSISLGLGRHSQLQPFQVYFRQSRQADGSVIRTNEDLDFTFSNHAVLAYDWNLTENLRIRLETYYQQITNAPVDPFSSSFSMLNEGANFGIASNPNLVNEGTGTNYGLELTVEKFYSNNYYFLFTGSLFESKYKGSDGIERSTAFNGQYVVNLLGGKEFNLSPKLAIFTDAKITYAGGRRFTPFDLAASQAAGFEIRRDNEAFSASFEDYFRLDFKLGFRYNTNSVTQEFFVDIQNITNRQNDFLNSYDHNIRGVRTTYQLGLFPNVQYRLTF